LLFLPNVSENAERSRALRAALEQILALGIRPLSLSYRTTAMRKIGSAAFALGLLAAPFSAAYAQSAMPSRTQTPTPGTYPPGSYNAPIHGTHDKGAAVRSDEGRSVSVDRHHRAQ
jgi:hypothetical protein